MTVEELIDGLTDAINKGDGDMTFKVMLDVAGRWTGIKGITVDAKGWMLFLGSED